MADQKDPLEVEVFTGYKCQECDEISEEFVDAPLYECPECGGKFHRDNGVGRHGNMCPECRNKFGSKIAERCCIVCEAGEVDEIDVFRCPCPNCTEVHPLDEATL